MFDIIDTSDSTTTLYQACDDAGNAQAPLAAGCAATSLCNAKIVSFPTDIVVFTPGLQIAYRRYRRGGGIAGDRGQHVYRAGADIARGKQSRPRGPHHRVGDDMAAGVERDEVLQEARSRLQPDIGKHRATGLVFDFSAAADCDAGHACT